MPYSVLMPVCGKDNPDHFALALDSMIGQSVPSDDIIVVKDGPIPAPLQQVLDARIASGTPIVQIQLEHNVGLGLALNAGIRAAKNELIARMDSDDYSLPTRCERQLEAFEQNPGLDIIGCPVLEFMDSIDHVVGRRNVPSTNREIYKFARKRDPFNHPTVMYRKSTLIKVGLYSDLRNNQDSDLWLRMFLSGAVCQNLAEPLLFFRFNANTYKKRKSWLNTGSLIAIRYRAWKSGFSSFADFCVVAGAQLGMYLLPIPFQRWLYKNILRR